MTSWSAVGSGRRRSGRGGRCRIEIEERETKTKVWYRSCQSLRAALNQYSER